MPVGEFEEWDNPKISRHYKCMKFYYLGPSLLSS